MHLPILLRKDRFLTASKCMPLHLRGHSSDRPKMKLVFWRAVVAALALGTLTRWAFSAESRLSGNAIVTEKYDVAIYGASTAGVSCALRAARQGLRVLLVHYHKHVGGMMTNGLGTFDTVYEGHRSPIFHEIH